MMIDRRRFVAAGLASAALAAIEPAWAQPTPPPVPLVDGQAFDAAQVVDLAQALSRRPFNAPANDLPDAFASLSYEQYATIHARPSSFLWSGQNRTFTIEPLHRGSLFRDQVALFVVEEGVVRRVPYDPSQFDLGRITPPPAGTDLGFSGFRVIAAHGSAPPTEVALFQGATFFRAIARGQTMGALARALILRPAETRGEEIPAFRAFWIERPDAGADNLVIHGIFDSESATGAVRFTLRPGDMTIMDVEETLFARSALDHVGLAGMTATFLFGPNNRRGFDDIRPAVWDAKGLQIFNGQGEWIWRPLNNPQSLQISAFVDANPRGFGLLQRDRDFASFEDDEQHFERRPSLWVTPLSDWGDGSVQLIEIPNDSEINDNVIAYWRPKQPLAAGSSFSTAYRQFWCWNLPERPTLATVAETRSGQGTAGRRRRFLVDFTGDALADSGAVAGIQPVLSASVGSLHNMRTWTYPERKSLRVGFELDPGNEPSSELRLVLEASGKPLSETWLYRWTP